MNKPIVFTILVAILTFICSCGESPVDKEVSGFAAYSGPYLGLEEPGSTPRLFMPGLISTYDMDGCVAFLQRGTVCVFSGWERGTLYTHETGGRWTEPQPVPWQNEKGVTDFTAGPDDRTIYFQTSRPTSTEDQKSDTNVWVVGWSGSGWGEAYPLPPPANTDELNESYPSMTAGRSVYFFTGSRPDSKLGDIYRSRSVEGESIESERLEFPVNTKYHEVDPIVAGDESFILFGSSRPGGFRTGDLYISFRSDDGVWMHPINAGENINSFCIPVRTNVTPDGKFFFIVSDRQADADKGDAVNSEFVNRYGDVDVYWVNTGFIDNLKEQYFGKESAGDAVADEYRHSGLQPAIDALALLYPAQRDQYYFELSEFMMLCGEMIESGKYDDAEHFCNALLEIIQEEFRIRQGYAVANIINGRTSYGLILLEDVLKLRPPTMPEFQIGTLAYCLSASGKQEDHLAVLRFAVEKLTPSEWAWVDLAEAYQSYGRNEEARAACVKALEMNPGNTVAADLLETLQP